MSQSWRWAHSATGHYVELALLTALVAALTVPLYVYRHQLVQRAQRRPGPRPGAPP